MVFLGFGAGVAGNAGFLARSVFEPWSALAPLILTSDCCGGVLV